ncbi:MAG: hypothetical protein ACOZB3_08945, partial [Calditrichota bacterium]
MKTILTAVMAVILMVSGLVWADDFSDFRIPKHRVYSLKGSAEGWLQNDYSRDDNYCDKRSTLNGALSETFRWIYDSDPLRFDFYQNFQGTGYDNHTQYTYRPDAFTSLERDTRVNNVKESWSVTGETRCFPWKPPLGMIGGFSASGRYLQEWESDHLDQYTYYYSGYYQDNQEFRFDYNLNVSIGLGYGRVRDATPVYSVYVLEHRLRELGVLTRELKPETRERLAQMLVAAADQRTIHDRPDKYYWQDIERILREDGGLRIEGLDAYSLYRIAESSNSPLARSNISLRRDCGWFAGIAVTANHWDTIQRTFQRRRDFHTGSGQNSVTEQSERRAEFGGPVEIGPQAEYHRPLGIAWQLDATGKVLFPIEDAPQAINATETLRITWMVADRWLAAGSASYNRIIRDAYSGTFSERQISNLWHTTLTGNLSYYVTDRFSFDLS